MPQDRYCCSGSGGAVDVVVQLPYRRSAAVGRSWQCQSGVVALAVAVVAVENDAMQVSKCWCRGGELNFTLSPRGTFFVNFR